MALEKMRFEDLGDGHTRIHVQSPVDSFEVRRAWQRLSVGVQALLDDEHRAASSFTHPCAGTHRLDDAIDRMTRLIGFIGRDPNWQPPA